MKFHVENLGKIKTADIELGDLTIICGPNSSNKTWLSYLICNVLDTMYDVPSYEDGSPLLNKVVETALDKGFAQIDAKVAFGEFINQLKKMVAESKDNLHEYFNVDRSTLKDLDITIESSFYNFIENYEHSWSPISTQETFSTEFTVSNNILSIEMSHEYLSNFKTNSSSQHDSDKARAVRDVFVSFNVFLSSIFSHSSFFKPRLISSERTGALIFQKDLDRVSLATDSLLREVASLDINSSDKHYLINKIVRSSYSDETRVASPVRKNMSDVRNAEQIMKKKGPLVDRYPYVIDTLDILSSGGFSFDDDEIKFTSKKESNTFKIGSTSSSVKSLFLIDLYIRHQVDEGDILLIDEPELNLHPDNQRLMARLLARIVNSGVKVVITTHSDYLIREINNAVMLSNEFDEKKHIMDKYDLIEQDTLHPSRISAYVVDVNGKVSEMNVGRKGINTEIFDQIINSANLLQSEIYFSLEDDDE